MLLQAHRRKNTIRARKDLRAAALGDCGGRPGSIARNTLQPHVVVDGEQLVEWAPRKWRVILNQLVLARGAAPITKNPQRSGLRELHCQVVTHAQRAEARHNRIIMLLGPVGTELSKTEPWKVMVKAFLAARRPPTTNV